MRTPEPDLTRVSWRKSSYSGGQGQCVEIARSGEWAAIRDSENTSVGAVIVSHDLLTAAWRKSSRSQNGSANCVELARTAADEYAVRDSKNPGGPVLRFGRARFASFLGSIRVDA
ncbi:DUF397 domain-containing protein [Saccharothrix coeruleofusca]|uniref:Toxin n=1 Tax=Saccharothrix coeruleofusca TaxID=33919 RepID=A0A918AH62_9PSEU|nr:DUF397 domain-containing protein [Saccharothrix coeruleofusca]MBP2340143.1 hypothetical protein [Saccharothrix coeruleofusca]GGP37051.1 toxin [Saccharothrix coeruleofusca]